MGGVDVSTVVTAVLALVLLVDVSVLWLTGRQVPELLMQLVSAVFGFYFGRGQAGRGSGVNKAKEG